MKPLLKNPAWKKRKGPVVLIIMDGVGYGKFPQGDAVLNANMKTLRMLEASCPKTRLKAHGKAVGLPSDEDMGNSEVGHNAMGCGRVFEQGAALVQASINSGALFAGDAWKRITGNVKNPDGTLHFIGLFSDGNVHSNLAHLKAMITEAKKTALKKVRIHVLWD
jgi:2,3-bisphosphoglycerate-independent phosphoglycerate mutase